MAESKFPNNINSSDEIDLGQLFRMIGTSFKRLFIAFLRLFLYLKKNAIILGSLIVLGVVIGFGLNQFVDKKMKIEVVVKPQIESKNYLYDVINEIQANIKARDKVFFSSIGIDSSNFDGLEIRIDPVTENWKSNESEFKYLELLQNFESTEAIANIVSAELQNKTSFNHRITFFYKDAKVGQQFANGVMEYINTNEYFNDLLGVYRKNSTSRIEENKQLLIQLDEIITVFTKKMGQDDGMVGNDRIVLDNQETVNITGLFGLKNGLIRDIESKNLELEKQTDPIKIINFGKPQQIMKPLFRKNIILFPIVLISIFFLFSIIEYLNRRVLELQ